MAERNSAFNRWINGFAYLGLTGTVVLMQILPIEILPGQVPGPDLTVAITFAWVLRRPQYLPTLLVAALFLAIDMLVMRPPGLWAALVVLAVEFLRKREPVVRELSFLLEWALVSGALLAITMVNRAVLGVFLVTQAGLGPMLLQLMATALAYPLVVAASRFLFAVHKMTPTETDARGRPR